MKLSFSLYYKLSKKRMLTENIKESEYFIRYHITKYENILKKICNELITLYHLLIFFFIFLQDSISLYSQDRIRSVFFNY